MAAAARSRSRAAPRRAPAARERSVSRSPKPSVVAAVIPAAVIPAKGNARKAAASVVGVPAFLKDLDLRDLLTKLMTAYIPAWVTLFLIEKFNLVGTYVAPHCIKMHGINFGQFSFLNMFRLYR